MKLIKTFILTVFLLISSTIPSQDTLLLLDGREIIGDVVFEDAIVVGLHVPKPLRPKNLNFYYKEESYSLSRKDSTYQVFYKQNSFRIFLHSLEKHFLQQPN